MPDAPQYMGTQHRITAVIADCARHAVEELVQIAQETLPRHTVEDERGIAKIANPDHRVVILAVAALHLSVKDDLALPATEKGAHQRE